MTILTGARAGAAGGRFDIDQMKGSTMDAMSKAVDEADVMLYGVSLGYKESGNCESTVHALQLPCSLPRPLREFPLRQTYLDGVAPRARLADSQF